MLQNQPSQNQNTKQSQNVNIPVKQEQAVTIAKNEANSLSTQGQKFISDFLTNAHNISASLGQGDRKDNGFFSSLTLPQKIEFFAAAAEVAAESAEKTKEVNKEELEQAKGLVKQMADLPADIKQEIITMLSQVNVMNGTISQVTEMIKRQARFGPDAVMEEFKKIRDTDKA